MRLVWEEIAEYGDRQISVIHTLCSHSRHMASIGSCYLCCSDCRAARTSKWPAMTGMKEWAEGRRAEKHSPEERAHFCTNNNSTSTAASHASKWNKLSKTNDSSEGIKVIAGDYPRFIWNDTALKTESLQMTCVYSIHHLYLIFGRSVKMTCISKKRWKLGAFGNSVLWGWISMPHQLANLRKAEIKTIELLIPTHLSPATVARHSERQTAFLQGAAALPGYESLHPEKCMFPTQILSTPLAMGWLIFAQRQNCNCNARQNKSSAWINDA